MSADQRPRRASPAASKSPASVRLQSRPPWNSFSSRPTAEDSPGTSRHRIEARPVSPVIRTATTHRRLQPNAVLPSTPHNAAATPSDVEAGLEQLQLFGQLQSVVVRLSQAAVSDKSKLTHMQQQLDAYVALVKDQDRLIDELRALNAKLQRERDALLEFRDGAALLERSPHREGHGHTLDAFNAHATPKTRTFVQSLVDQLREEKRVRLQVEEQSSRMIGEQQITIHRLEDRLRQQLAPHTSPTRVRTPRQGATPPHLPAPHSQQQQHRSNPMEFTQPAAPIVATRDAPQYSARADNHSPNSEFIRLVGDEGGASSRSASVGGVVISVDNATELLEKIKLRHGLR